jgi:hypothetical protein
VARAADGKKLRIGNARRGFPRAGRYRLAVIMAWSFRRKRKDQEKCVEGLRKKEHHWGTLPLASTKPDPLIHARFSTKGKTGVQSQVFAIARSPWRIPFFNY